MNYDLEKLIDVFFEYVLRNTGLKIVLVIVALLIAIFSEKISKLWRSLDNETEPEHVPDPEPVKHPMRRQSDFEDAMRPADVMTAVRGLRKDLSRLSQTLNTILEGHLSFSSRVEETLSRMQDTMESLQTTIDSLESQVDVLQDGRDSDRAELQNFRQATDIIKNQLQGLCRDLEETTRACRALRGTKNRNSICGPAPEAVTD